MVILGRRFLNNQPVAQALNGSCSQLSLIIAATLLSAALGTFQLRGAQRPLVPGRD